MFCSRLFDGFRCIFREIGKAIDDRNGESVPLQRKPQDENNYRAREHR